ncbi:MAG TPA: hypothetical protein VIU29_08855 [Candidatus Deferrimicrobiaceae bacterium]
MFRSLLCILLLLVLVPAVTGWAGDSCCPPDESRCGSACGEMPLDSRQAADHDHNDPGHQQALCGCDCHAMFLSAAPVPLAALSCMGLLETSDPPIPSNAHLSDIYRPPLA